MGKGPKARRIKARTWESIAGYGFLSPFVLGFSIFTVIPMVATLFMSFTDWNLFDAPSFIGFENYMDLFEDKVFWQSMKATLLYCTGGVILPLVAALLIALLLNQRIRCRAFFRTAFYLPTVLPAVSSVVLWQWMFDPDAGPLNSFLNMLGMEDSKWIYSESSVMPSLWLMAIWGCGNAVVIFLAALQDVPKHLQEAAEIDGANVFQRFRSITVPAISPVLFFQLLMSVIGAFQVFVPAQLMTGGGPNNSTLFAAFYIYRLNFTEYRMGYACSLAFVVFLMIMMVAAIIFKTSNKWVFYNEEQK